MRICLCMIVKDEQAVVGRCLRSALPHVDAVAVVDTGSTDRTLDVVRREADAHGVPWFVESRPWVGFSHNRNEALDLARHALETVTGAVEGALPDDAFILLLDADEELHLEPGWTVPDADASAAKLVLSNSEAWLRRVLVRANRPWRYVGEIHERVELEGDQTLGHWSCATIVNRNDSGAAADKRGQGRRYARVLERQLGLGAWNRIRGVLTPRPELDAADEARCWFYLGQAYAAEGRTDDAIAAFERRAAMPGGFPEEVYCALFHAAVLRELRGDSHAELVAAHLRAYQSRPTRAEPLFALAVLHSDRGDHAAAELFARAACAVPRPPDVLPVHEAVYAWRCADELAGALVAQGKVGEALPLLRALASLNLPAPDGPRQAANLAAIEAAVADAVEVPAQAVPEVPVPSPDTHARAAEAFVLSAAHTPYIDTFTRPTA